MNEKTALSRKICGGGMEGGGMAVPISHEPNDLRLGRYFLKIISAQSLRGGKNPSTGRLQPPP